MHTLDYLPWKQHPHLPFVVTIPQTWDLTGHHVVKHDLSWKQILRAISDVNWLSCFVFCNQKKRKRIWVKSWLRRQPCTVCTVQVCNIRSVMFPGQLSHRLSWNLWNNPQINLIIWTSKSSRRSGDSTYSSPIGDNWENWPQNQV